MNLISVPNVSNLLFHPYQKNNKNYDQELFVSKAQHQDEHSMNLHTLNYVYQLYEQYHQNNPQPTADHCDYMYSNLQ